MDHDSKSDVKSKAKRRELKSRQARKNALMELSEQGRLSATSSILSSGSSRSRCRLAANFNQAATSSVDTEVEDFFKSQPRLSTTDATTAAETTAAETTAAAFSSSSNELSDVAEIVQVKGDAENPLKKPASKLKNSGYVFQNYQQGDGARATGSKSNMSTEAKLSSIMSYLDQVENETTAYEARQAEDSSSNNNRKRRSWNKLEIDDIEQKSSEVTQEMLKMRLDFEEKKKNVSILEQALKEQRSTMKQHADTQVEDTNRQLSMQKQQYEATIQRHLTFIDQLIDDKKVLNSKCEDFVKELKTLDDKYQRKIKTMNDSQRVTTKKVRCRTRAYTSCFYFIQTWPLSSLLKM